MPERQRLPFGSWPSPISVEMAVAGSLALREPRLDGDHVYWIEGRPQQGGRQVIVRWEGGAGTRDVTPAEVNVRTMAHEYGGGSYAVHEGTVCFSNLADGRLYRHAVGSAPAPLTEAGPFRYGDLVFDPSHERLLCVREDHRPVQAARRAVRADGRGAEPRNELVAIDLASGDVSVLASGHDFYSTPRPSVDGRRLCWLAWRHPNMPWDGCELWLADIDDAGRPVDLRLIAGGPAESIVQPEWATDGSLTFVSDRSGWWNLYRLANPDAQELQADALAPMEAEFAGPQWVFGMSWYGIGDDGSLLAIARRHGRDDLWRIPIGGEPQPTEVPETELRDLGVAGKRAVYIGASPTTAQAVVLLDESEGSRRVLRRSSDIELDPGYISVAEPISFPTADGHVAHALYYPPTNRDVEGPSGERPPLVVMSHGGPTSAAWGGLNLEKQLFTSRGFAVVDVDYGGSVGYGRAYMRRLDGQWGKVDVEDCINAARFLARRGDVDERRMAIRGGSAGGFTTLAALVFHDVFACGASHYGVGDLEALARDTHKFESRYLDRLVAPYPAGLQVYRERSPIHSCEQLERPVIVLQGADDKVVPVAQAETLVDVLRARHIPHAYLLFEGEGHGFRQAHNIRRAWEAELSFYAQVFGFELADPIEPVSVEFAAEGRH